MNRYSSSAAGSLEAFPSFLIVSILLFFSACRQQAVEESPREAPRYQTPREVYLSALEANGLAKTQMARQWAAAGEQALEDSIILRLPTLERGYFPAESPTAFSYRMKLKMGVLLEMDLRTDPDSILFFADLFQVFDTDSTVYYRPVLHGENHQTGNLVYEVREEGTYLLRLQPELLATGRFTLSLIVQPAYGTFPVQGKSNRDIWSFFGAPRDGGRRKHKGIDIFARRGTPAIATVDGVIRSVRDRGLGGKQVWLYDRERNQSIYYAHLDSQLVSEGQRVVAGDTLGLVGNTGNARNTRPHLHFAIYRRGFGAVDPHPFVAYRKEKGPRVRADTSRLGRLVRVRSNNAVLRPAPRQKAPQLIVLSRHQPLLVLGVNQSWYRLQSPEGLVGYLAANQVEDVDRPIGKMQFPDVTELLDTPSQEGAPVAVLPSAVEVEIIATSGNFQLVRNEKGETGWANPAVD